MNTDNFITDIVNCKPARLQIFEPAESSFEEILAMFDDISQSSNAVRLGHYASKNATRPDRLIDWGDLITMVKNPSISPKLEAACLSQHDSPVGKTGEAASTAKFSIVAIDYDDGFRIFSDVYREWVTRKVNFLMFTTSSHTEKHHKFKVLLPLAQAVDAEQWRSLARGLSLLAGGDLAQARPGQVFFAPNKITEDSGYQTAFEAGGDDFSQACPLWDEAITAFEANRETAEAKTSAKPRRLKNANDAGIVELINEAYDIEMLLTEHGYRAKGGKYISPNSSSGIAGVSILERDGKAVVYSHHGEADPLSALNHGGHALDVADVLCVLRYNGDSSAMIKAEAALLDPQGQKARQREYAVERALDAALTVLGGALSFDDATAIAGSFTAETSPGEIRDLLQRAAMLGAVESEALLKNIKSRTGIGLAALREEMHAALAKPAPINDHGKIAAEIIGELGAENIIADDGSVWRWDDSGVWFAQRPEEIRRLVLDFIDGNFDDDDVTVTDQVVRSIGNLLHTRAYRKGVVFNDLTRLSSPDSFVCINGEVGYSAGHWVLQPHKRENYMTALSPVTFDPEAKAPRFERFLEEILPFDIESQTALLEMIAYSLMAHCRYERFILLIGEGSNGKSVVLRVVEMLLGAHNCAGVQPAQFSSEFHRAALHGKLVNIVSEIPVGLALDDSLKAIVSGEPVTVSEKYKPHFTMRPFATCWFGTNQFPQNRDFSDGLYRRALMLRFQEKFSPELGNCDPDLLAKLGGELSGILNMALSAYGTAIKRGSLSRPALGAETMGEWALEADQVKAFVDECCLPDPNGRIMLTDLYAQYRQWADDAGRKNLVNSSTMRQRLERLGFSSKRMVRGWEIFGLSFANPDFDEFSYF